MQINLGDPESLQSPEVLTLSFIKLAGVTMHQAMQLIYIFDRIIYQIMPYI